MCDILGDGITYDRQEDIPVLNSFLTLGQCVVHVRPDSAWEGKEFGFDWIRINDSGIKGDVPYHKNVGRYRNQTNENSTSGPFDAQAPLFQNLTQTYFPEDKRIVWKWESTHGDNDQDRLNKEARFRYYIPVMTLQKGSTASLNLIVEMDTTRTAPDRIDISTSGEPGIIFSLSTSQLTGFDNNSNHPLTVKCNQDTMDEQYILFEAVYANATTGEEEKHICGMVRILPNYRKRKLKVLFVRMSFNDQAGELIDGTRNEDHINYAKRILKQAMIELDYNTTPVNYFMEDTHPLRSTLLKNYSGGVFTQEGSLKGLIFSSYSLYKYLSDQKILKKYKDHIIVVFLGADCKTSNGFSPGSTSHFDPSHTINLYDSSGKHTSQIESNAGGAVLMFGTTYTTQETLVHEILHAAGLKHSFANSSPYTYKGTLTDNIMDYSHNARPAVPRIATWQWQWRILWDYIDRLTKLENDALAAEIAALGLPNDSEEYFNSLIEQMRTRIEEQKMKQIEEQMKNGTPDILDEMSKKIEMTLKEELHKDKTNRSLRVLIDAFNKRKG
ncbi:hypothetical protein [Dysgonomonas sp. 25]|uniref:hypothetical protein n=1 Tax=Dysgonomonas sp. 25 TaxID=2302933 RepID=UPI0013D5641D|nr:hypothetical protein [Dysgonomonas sp. 25]NDV67903.1 hypothetical protein [Dysgonomonas sp. 25]